MGRIGNGVCGLLLALGLFACPVTARASDGFLGGLEDLTGTREVQEQGQSYEERYQRDYEPEPVVLFSPPVRELTEDSTTVDYVNDTLDSFNSVQWSSGFRSLLDSITNLIITGWRYSGFYVVVTGLVFMWWGVRKSKNMIMTAFRKGKASV